LAEVWSWLESEGFLARIPALVGEFVFITRRGERLHFKEDFAAYRKATLLPKAQLHPVLAARVYPAFLRGEYDTAVFQAFREIEVAVRQAGNDTKLLLIGMPQRDSGPQVITVALNWRSGLKNDWTQSSGHFRYFQMNEVARAADATRACD
jgi:Protein of unknown function (Hypoth_ymh)